MNAPGGGAGEHDTIDVALAGAGVPANSFGFLWSGGGREAPTPGAPAEVVLVAEDALARHLRVRAPDGGVVVLEVQRDVVDPVTLPATWSGAGNLVLQAVWRRRAAAAFAGERRGGAPPALSLDENPPLLYCREKGVAFRPPSPVTARPEALEECRSDETLRTLRLPVWSTTTARFLHDSAAARSAVAPRLWTPAAEAPRGAAAEVGTFERLARDFGRVLDLAAAGDAEAQRLRGSFPCLGCDQVPRCYGRPAPGSSAPPREAPLVARRLAPVAMMPFRAIAHREEAATFDEHCDLLGGAPWTAFRARHVAKWTLPGRRFVREALEGSLVGRAEAATPLAAVREKLRLFEAVVAEVARYHRAHGQPHLGLSPATIVSHRLFPGPDEDYEVELRGGLCGVSLDDLMPPPPGPPLWMPPPGATTSYAHADVAAAAEPRATAPADGAEVHANGFRYARNAPVRVVVGRVWTDESRGTTEFELDVTGLVERGGLELDPTDRVRIQVEGPGWAGTTLWCRRDHERVAAAGAALRAFPQRLASGQVLDLRAASRSPLFGSAAVYRSFGAFYDLHSLGMLLLRALLDNSKNDLARIVADVVPSVMSFARAVKGRDGHPGIDELTDVLANVTRSPPLDAFLGDANACFYPGERIAPEGRVPARAWAAILATAAACMTRSATVGFSDGSRLETDREEFCKPIERLLARVKELRRTLPRSAAATASTPPPAPAAAAAEPSWVAAAAAAAPPSTPLGAPAASPAAPAPRPAADPRDQLIRRLEEELRSASARMERLDAEVQALQQTRTRASPAPPPVKAPDPAAADAWRALRDAALGHARAPAPPARPGDPQHEIVKSIVADGLEALSTLLSAVAELGGQEFAAEQRNLQRLVRQALESAAQNAPDAAQRTQEALAQLRAAKTTLGSTIGMLVEAHGRSTRDGSKKLLLTLNHAMQKELDLDKSRRAKLDDIIRRMNAGLPELVARFYDADFEEQVRRHLRKQ